MMRRIPCACPPHVKPGIDAAANGALTYRRESSTALRRRRRECGMGGSPEKRPWSGEASGSFASAFPRYDCTQFATCCFVSTDRRPRVSRTSRPRASSHDGREGGRSNKTGLGGHRFGGDTRGQYERQIPRQSLRDGNPPYPTVVHPAVRRQHIVTAAGNDARSKAIVRTNAFVPAFAAMCPTRWR